MALTPGTRLGPYSIVGPLGEGGMGEVYRARDTRLGRDVEPIVLLICEPDGHLGYWGRRNDRSDRTGATVRGPCGVG